MIELAVIIALGILFFWVGITLLAIILAVAVSIFESFLPEDKRSDEEVRDLYMKNLL